MLKDKMMMLLKKKKQEGSELGDMEKQAKMSVVKDLRDTMAGEMADRLKGGLKKVTVASDSPEGLKEGLEKAEDMVESKMGDSSMSESLEEPEESEESEDSEEMSPEEIDAMIAKLQAMKMKK